MPEQVQTGGLIQFNYPKHIQSELDPERRSAISDAYDRSIKRRKEERTNKIIFWIILALLILAILGYILLRN